MDIFPQLKDNAYHIEAELGVGGGGVVYKAWHARLQKYVVLKRIRDESRLQLTGRTRSETDILKDLKHPNLPQLYDFIDDPSGIYTVIEYIPGKSFAALLKEGKKFTQQQIIYWAEQLSSALAYLHSQNPPVLHSDIKPANIMLTPGGDICLIDFNISLVLDGENASAIGLSHGYAPPEQYIENIADDKGAKDHICISDAETQLPTIPPSAPQSSPSVQAASASAQQASPSAPQSAPSAPQASPSAPQSAALVASAAQSTQSPSHAQASQSSPQTAPSQSGGAQSSQSSSSQRRAKARLDTRSDIYSLGATLYHLATGEKPLIASSEIKPLSSVKRFSDAFVYIVERCMERDSSKRFQTAASLHNAIINIHKYDTRLKAEQLKMAVAAIILFITFALFATLTLFGNYAMTQEKESRYYNAILDITNGNDARSAYNSAASIFPNRIDHYHAMALRLWDDGNYLGCMEYIKSVLGDLAVFQTVPESRRHLGDIYYILGNCYYYQPGMSDYALARGNFEIAIEYVSDNPLYFRDYAITLARTGRLAEAEQALETARGINLDSVSLTLLNGEIAAQKRDYVDALQYFKEVIDSASDEYLRYRAYAESDDILSGRIGQYERSVELLEDAINRKRVPYNLEVEIIERLANAWFKLENYDAAIVLLERLLTDNLTYAQPHIMLNLVRLLFITGDIDRADDVLNEMDAAFPGDYRTPMWRAFLENEKQSKTEVENRDYTKIKEFYNTANSLYNERTALNESDPEMQQLSRLIEQLKANKWID